MSAVSIGTSHQPLPGKRHQWPSRTHRPDRIVAPGRLRISRLVVSRLLLLCSLIVAGNACIAQVKLEVTDSLNFRVRGSTAENSFSFLLLGSPDTVRGLRVMVMELRDPSGKQISREGLSVSPEFPYVTSAGTRVQILLRSAFSDPGDYRATLIFHAAGLPEPYKKSLVITRPAASLGTDDIDGFTFRIYRSAPFCSAESDADVSLSNTGISDIESMTVQGNAVLVAGTKEVAKGRVMVNYGAGTRSPVALPARGTIPLRLRFSDFERTGEFSSAIIVNSPNLDKQQRIPVTIKVTDKVGFPLLAIVLGVGLAALISYNSQKWRPLQEERLRIVELQGEVERLRTIITDPRKLERIDRMKDALRLVLERNERGVLDGQKSRLEEIERELEDLRKQEREELNVLWEQLETVSTQIRQNNLNDLAGEAEAIETLLVARRSDEARRKIAAIIAKMKERMPPPDPNSGQGARPGRRSVTAGGYEEDVMEMAFAQIRIVDPPDGRVVGSMLSFQIDEDLVQRTDLLYWDFGDGSDTAMVAGEHKSQHQFSDPGEYLIRVSIRRPAGAGKAPQEIRKLFTRITIRPGRTMLRLAGITHRLWFNSFMLAVIAVILASLSGLTILYLGKVFGSALDYISAFLWGIGINSGVQGFAEVWKKVK